MELHTYWTVIHPVRQYSNNVIIPSFVFVDAEICEWNQNKKNFENGCFQLNTFPGHIIDPFFHQGHLLIISTIILNSTKGLVATPQTQSDNYQMQ